MLPLLLLLVAQDINLEETVISAPRAATTVTTTSAKATVITARELQATNERSLPRAIGEAAGIWIQETNMGGGAPVIRGFIGNHVLILVDGVRLNDSTTRLGPNQSLNTIDPAIVERVEIIRGPGSVLYGSDAIGGVISIWTKRRRASSQDPAEYLKPWQGEIDIAYDSSFTAARFALGLSAAHEDHGGLGVASGFDYDDYHAGDNETIPFTGYNGQALFGSYEYALAKRRTLRITGRVSRDFNVPRTDRLIAGYGQMGPANGDYRYSLQDRRGYVVSLTDTNPGQVADRMQLRLNLHTYTEERDIANTTFTSSSFQREEVVTVGLGADWQSSLSDEHLLTWGLDISHDEVDSFRENTTAAGTMEVAGTFAPGARYTRLGFFLQDEIFSFDPWFFTAGLRYSYFDFAFGKFGTQQQTGGQFGALTAALEAARDLGDGVIMTGTVAQGFRAPNLDDLANDGTFGGGQELSNPALDPEQSLSLELALAIDKSDWSGSLAVFGTQVHDKIGRVLVDAGNPNTTGDETYRRENTGEVELVGAELAGRVRLGDDDSPYSLDGNVAYVQGREKDPLQGSGSVPARRVPPLNGRLALTYSPEEAEWFYLPNARASIVWADGQNRLHPQDVSDPRIDPNGTAGWVTYNFDVWGEINADASWKIGLYNLTTETYRVHASGVDAPGRRVVVGLHLEF
jgi:outer membrane receptor protein involved in Fe transport